MSLEAPPMPGIVPTIMSPDSIKHIAWIKNVFNAQQKEIYHSSDNKTVMHCSLIVNKGYIYLNDRSTAMEKKAINDEKESRGTILHLELEDPKPFWKNALNNGATVVEDLKQQTWGALYGSIRDPFGFVWALMKGGECRKPGVIPYLVLEQGKCESHAEWLVEAFGGKIKDKVTSNDNLIAHCWLEINGGHVYLADNVEMQNQKAEISGCTSDVVCHMNLPNPKSSWEAIIQKGAESIVDLKVQFWGDLYGSLKDKMGYMWSISEKPPPNSTTCKQNGVISYIVSPDCKKHISWIETVFGGKVKVINHTDTNKIMHCMMEVNGGMLMLSDQINMPDATQPSIDSTSSSENGSQDEQKGFVMHLYVPDPDAIWKKAMGNGGIQQVELKEQFWGDYYGQFQDPFGYRWSVMKS